MVNDCRCEAGKVRKKQKALTGNLFGISYCINQSCAVFCMKLMHMKKILPVIIIFLSGCGTATTNTTDPTLPISSYPYGQKITALDTVKHKAGDIEVFRIIGKDTAYVARFYRLDNNEVRQYETVIVEGTNYDRVSYRLVNDSTAIFDLVDSKNKKTKSFQLTGSGATTSLQEIE
jgi:hypothetical protein